MGVRFRRFLISIHVLVSTELYLQKQGIAGVTFSSQPQGTEAIKIVSGHNKACTCDKQDLKDVE